MATPIPVRKIIARNLRWLKKDRRLAWWEIADRVGVTQRQVYRWAHDSQSRPDDANLVKLAEALDVTPGWLIEAHEETRRA